MNVLITRKMDFGAGKGNQDLIKKNKWCLNAVLATMIDVPLALSFMGSAHAKSEGQGSSVGDVAGLEISAQLLYLATLLGLVGVGTFFVVRQLLVQRELESAAKSLQVRLNISFWQ